MDASGNRQNLWASGNPGVAIMNSDWTPEMFFEGERADAKVLSELGYSFTLVFSSSKEGEWATYDFTQEIRPLQFGVNLSADFDIAGGFGISADLDWGLTGLLKSSFKTVDRPLYPIYGTLGLFYRF